MTSAKQSDEEPLPRHGENAPARILIIQLKRIGDVILTTPVLTCLRERFPNTEITLAIDANAAALAPALETDRTLVFRKGAPGLIFWKRILAARFDVCLDFTGNDRSALVTAVSRARRRLTYARFAKKPLRKRIYTEFVDSSVRDRHTADHHTDLLRPLGIDRENVPSVLRLPDEACAEADDALRTAGIAEPFAVIHAGTARPEKYWLPERWAEVIQALANDHGLPVVLTGSNAAAEREHLAAILSKTAAADFSGKLTLPGTAAVIARARILCAVDSAPVHIADAVGTPVVALFGPTNPHHWHPRRSAACVVTPPAAGEIHSGSKGRPMSEIPSDAIIRAITECLRE